MYPFVRTSIFRFCSFSNASSNTSEKNFFAKALDGFCLDWRFLSSEGAFFTGVTAITASIL